MVSVTCLRVALPLACAAALAAQNYNLAIVEKKAGAVGFYSPAGQRLAGVKIGEHPHEIVVAPDGRTAYISDNGILWMQYAGEGGNTISIVDLRSRMKLGTIDLGNYRRPHGMDIDPKRNRLVSTIENPDGLLLIDLAARKVIRKYDVQGEDPHMVFLSPDGEVAFVSNTSTATLAAIHLESGKTKLIPTDKRPQGAVLSQDAKLFYLTNSEGNSITIIDIARQENIGRISTGQGPNRIALLRDGKTLVYSMQAGESVGFADIPSRKQTAEIKLPGPPLSLSLSPDGNYAYIGVQDQDTVAIVSTRDRKIVRTFKTPAGAGPDPVLPLP
jgi:DNA-binding beta-propeller fold protein YncE